MNPYCCAACLKDRTLEETKSDYANDPQKRTVLIKYECGSSLYIEHSKEHKNKSVWDLQCLKTQNTLKKRSGF